MGALAAHRSTTARALVVASLSALGIAGCGGGQAQDANAPTGRFPVTVVSATFPADQHLAKTSNVVIVVRNPGTRTIPNINVTMKCATSGLRGSFEQLSQTPGVADPRRPQFVVNTIPERSSGNRPPLDPAPAEASSSLVDTYPLGALAPGQTTTFRWNVTAVMAGPYDVCYRVNTDLYGKARPVPVAGSLPLAGAFVGSVSNVAPKAGIAPDGKTVTTSSGP